MYNHGADDIYEASGLDERVSNDFMRAVLRVLDIDSPHSRKVERVEALIEGRGIRDAAFMIVVALRMNDDKNKELKALRAALVKIIKVAVDNGLDLSDVGVEVYRCSGDCDNCEYESGDPCENTDQKMKGVQ